MIDRLTGWLVRTEITTSTQLKDELQPGAGKQGMSMEMDQTMRTIVERR